MLSPFFEHEMHVAVARHGAADGLGELGQDMLAAVVADRVDRIEAQPVDGELLDPVERVVDEEVAHDARTRPVEIDAGAPWRPMPPGEELRRVEVQIVAFGTKMIVDDIQKYHQTLGVRRLDQGLQQFRTAVLPLRRKRLHAVIAPVVPAGCFGKRHQFDSGDPQSYQMIEFFADASVGSGRRKSADMQFVEHGLLPGAAVPCGVLPGEGGGVDHLARAVNIVGLMARRRVGHRLAGVDDIGIAAAWPRRRGREFEPAFPRLVHRQARPRTLGAQPQRDIARRRRPQAKSHLAVRQHRGAERHGVGALHAPSFACGRPTRTSTACGAISIPASVAKLAPVLASSASLVSSTLSHPATAGTSGGR